MSEYTLPEFVQAIATEFEIPGVSVGVWADGQESYASHGVTNIDHPLPVDQDTMFVLGSVTKPTTATAIMRLVADGRLELDAPVRRYVPEFTLPDERAAAEITVAQLLNHTAGLDWRLSADTGEGDDALAENVAKMAESELISEPGARASYSQLGFSLAGRIIEKATGLTYERAISELVFEPLGMSHSAFALNDVITQRFAVGHNAGENSALSVVRQWKDNRGNNPGGGLVSSVADQIRLARFHLDAGRTQGGTELLPAELVRQMQQPTVELKASTLGDAFGICWFLREVNGVATVGHGGSANGQFADLLIVPERNFAVVVMSNAGPDSGLAANQMVVKWALEHYLGVVEQAPEPLPYDAALATEVAGDYSNEIMIIALRTDGSGLTIECFIKPEVRAASDTEMAPDMPVADFGLLPDDEFIVTSGGLDGQRGAFTRDEGGAIIGLDLAGRFFGKESVTV
ncbi:beta-lactamase family protein [Nocardia uniformis]|uniref:Beta-lactamase family protein n=1 Tax=Nocardia uniformis TaxID=53432 RepID=A0A849CDH9_9NOCA|nr:serine hydrolase domain-containing protein [Nocardia uniformis]NNH74475.1 beta-lactamase family protein [Nocardia uniformis]